jgi:hypothetical protein
MRPLESGTQQPAMGTCRSAVTPQPSEAAAQPASSPRNHT